VLGREEKGRSRMEVHDIGLGHSKELRSLGERVNNRSVSSFMFRL
jgi:hypothetical protein